MHHDSVTGPTTHIADRSEIVKRKAFYKSKHYGKSKAAIEELVFVKLLPRELNSFDDVI